MGLVLTVDKDLAISFGGKVYIEFNHCDKKNSKMSVLDTDSLKEFQAMLEEGQEYKFLVDGQEVKMNLITEKSFGKNKSRINIEAPRTVSIGRVTLDKIPDLEYEYISYKEQIKKHKPVAQQVKKEEQPDILKERYKNELAWFYNL